MNSTTVSVREAAMQLGVTLQHVYKLIWDGSLDGRKVDGKWQIYTGSLKERVAQRAGEK